LKAVAWVEAPLGRARQMNAGARAARGRHLWFLHADSGFSRPDVEALATALREAPRALHYFNLAFDGRPRQLMYLNQAGAWWRSHALGLPFGDQGFCLERDAFFALGGYDEQAAYGEDHLLVWQARRAGIEVRCTRGRIVTSARKYREQGWLRTTILHQYLTYRQAAPELFKSWARKP
jgi:GT2 family glycosyltransferase